MRFRDLAPLLLSLILIIQIAPASATTNHYTYTATYTFTNRGSAPVSLTRDDVSSSLFLDDSHQTVTVASATPPLGATYTDEDGNTLADPTTNLTIPPGGNVTYTVVYDITSNDSPRPQLNASSAGTMSNIPAALVANYTGSTDTFWPNDTKIADLARSLTAGQPTVLGKVTRLVQWFHANVTYATHELPNYPNQTLQQRTGDCDDQSILLISMLRSLGIPAYLEIGVVFDSTGGGSETVWNGHLAITETGLAWHGWTMVYTPPWGWIPVDLTLASNNDPLQMVQSAPEYTAPIVTAMKISRQSYTGASVESRQRIITSDIYVASVETVQGVQASWIDPTMIILAVALVAAIGFMFYTSRRQQPI